MNKLLPSLYSLLIENIKQKIDFYRNINLDSWIVDDTKNLMQSTKLSYARYNFFKNNEIDIIKKL